MPYNIETYSFLFKIPNREKCIMYTFHTNVTIKYFIEFIEEEMLYIFPNNSIEIFETTNDHKINYLDTLTLEQVYADKIKEISFYIKLKKKV